ncbi:LamB/YcsF family protein [Agromyces indicus]|uniref:5-oxoprolinase subunit A n=1 Tax=Agromyces indicus TaxID=758919 RepID=A0ABU1FMV7_9MICO|nr:5-oxoprolinase subunit PxpA [Agromyces indicus]MDR5692595.1 5-oxoprolinase subunit PxpA [Agromyces indicus]
MERAIDLNADLGEGYGAWRMGDDDAMFALVTSANVACGFHAGDPLTMARSARLAVEHGVALGAHPGYRDRAGFGRRELAVTPEEAAAEVVYQLGALAAVARTAGTAVRYVKAHGALYHRLDADRAAAVAVLEALAAFDPAIVVLGPPAGGLERAAGETGIRYAREAFIDRGYLADGRLVPRTHPGALVHDPSAAVDRALELVETGGVAAHDGSRVELEPDSLCLHGDTPGAVGLARAVRAALDAAGHELRPFA